MLPPSQLLEELATGAGNKNPAGDAALAVFHPFDDARGFAAFGAVGTLGCVHDLLAVGRLGNLRHRVDLLTVVSRSERKTELKCGSKEIVGRGRDGCARACGFYSPATILHDEVASVLARGLMWRGVA